MSVRPEALTFGSVLDSPNRIPGRIIDTTYLGSSVQYLIQVTGGPQIKVCETNPQDIRLPGEEEVRVMAAMGDVVILRK
jgi:iron(III) transport system ATP-binding protein